MIKRIPYTSFVIVLFIFSVPVVVLAQSAFLERGVSGPGAEFNYAGMKRNILWTGSVGFSFNGFADFSYGYGQASNTEDRELGKSTAQSISMTVIPIKQDTVHTDVSLSITMGFGWANHFYRVYYYQIEEETYKMYLVSIGILKKFPLTSTSYMVGSVQLGYSYTALDRSTSGSENLETIGFSLAYAQYLSSNIILTITPQVSTSVSDLSEPAMFYTTYGISAGIIFPLDIKLKMDNW